MFRVTLRVRKVPSYLNLRCNAVLAVSQTFLWNWVMCVWSFPNLHYSTSKRLRSQTKAILYTQIPPASASSVSESHAKSGAVSRCWPLAGRDLLSLKICDRHSRSAACCFSVTSQLMLFLVVFRFKKKKNSQVLVIFGVFFVIFISFLCVFFIYFSTR